MSYNLEESFSQFYNWKIYPEKGLKFYVTKAFYKLSMLLKLSHCWLPSFWQLPIDVFPNWDKICKLYTIYILTLTKYHPWHLKSDQ